MWEEGSCSASPMLDARHNARFFHITSFDLHSNLRDGMGTITPISIIKNKAQSTVLFQRL